MSHLDAARKTIHCREDVRTQTEKTLTVQQPGDSLEKPAHEPPMRTVGAKGIKVYYTARVHNVPMISLALCSLLNCKNFGCTVKVTVCQISFICPLYPAIEKGFISTCNTVMKPTTQHI